MSAPSSETELNLTIEMFHVSPLVHGRIDYVTVRNYIFRIMFFVTTRSANLIGDSFHLCRKFSIFKINYTFRVRQINEYGYACNFMWHM